MIAARKHGWFYCACYCAPRPQLGLESHCARHCPNTRKEQSLTRRSAVLINLYLFVQLLVYYWTLLFALEGKCSQIRYNESGYQSQHKPHIAYRKHGNIFLVFIGASLKFQLFRQSWGVTFSARESWCDQDTEFLAASWEPAS